jgi:beta-galactosidase
MAIAAEQPARETLSLDQAWRFHLGDVPFPVVSGHEASYFNAKAGKAGGAAAPEYDDSSWRELDLPHDWAVEGPFDEHANLSQGFRPRGIGWYRRQFNLDPQDQGKHLELQFDGVATHSTVWFNGTVVARNWCGYTSFNIDITPLAQYGDKLNTISVRVDADAMEGWWYEGAGIYRHTWLVKRNPVHVVTDGIFANPIPGESDRWTVPVEVALENSGAESADTSVLVTLTDPAGAQVVSGKASAAIAPLAQTTVKIPLSVSAPKRWSIEDPSLYRLHVSVSHRGAIADEVETSCGFRTIRFDPDQGFFLNDRPLKIKGVCNHQDHAGVGVAVPDSLWEFRLRKTKEMGANAWRSSHNPPAKEFLDACDRLGMLVIDENRNFNASPECLGQLQWMVRRDRNHPSIVLWSLFNEETLQDSPQGFEIARRMRAAVKELDATRPVTAAMSRGHFTPINASQALDVVGFNYTVDSYDRYHAEHPKLPLVSTEDTSAFMTRGEYTTDKSRNVFGSYDLDAAKWGATHRANWKAIATRPYLAGGFVWTGFDYRGEPLPLKWPTASCFFGCMDLCGFPKTAFYIHQAQWIEDRPILSLAPHWNWPGQEGKPIEVMGLTNCDSVALYLNGKPLGEKTVDKFEMVQWSVPYARGRLEAIGKKNDKEVAHFTVETSGPPAALRLTPDRSQMSGDGCDAIPVTVEAIDSDGRPVPTASAAVEFELAGPGAIIGLGNGDPNCHEPEKGNGRSLFDGVAQVIVQTHRAAAGNITLQAKAEGLKPAETTIEVQSAAAPPSVPKAASRTRDGSQG